MSVILVIVVLAVLGAVVMGNEALITGDIDESVGVVVFAIVFDAIIVTLIFCVISNFIVKKYEFRSEEKLSNIKNNIIFEISDRIRYKKRILNKLNSFFEHKKQTISFNKLMDLCSENSTSFDYYIAKENDSFMKTRNELLESLDHIDSKRFPEDLSQVTKYIEILQEEIDALESTLSSLASSDKIGTDKIVTDFCPKLSKKIKCRKRKIALLFSCLTIIFVAISAVLLSTNFTMFLAENYHKQALNEHIQKLGYEHLLVNDIEYEQIFNIYNTYNEYQYKTCSIEIICDVPYAECFVADMSAETNKLYNEMNIEIKYLWAGKTLWFENDDEYIVNIIDTDGKEIKINCT